VASRFFGRFEHSLDTKGRVVLPARFRTSFDAHAFATQHTDGCVALWTPEEFFKRLEAMERNQERSASDRNLARIWAGGSAEVEIDRQGRVAIPPYLREFARLDGNVLVMGALERIEVWNPAEWEARVRPAEASLIDPPDPPGPELTG
jgi:MraZ protein